MVVWQMQILEIYQMKEKLQNNQKRGKLQNFRLKIPRLKIRKEDQNTPTSGKNRVLTMNQTLFKIVKTYQFYKETNRLWVQSRI